ISIELTREQLHDASSEPSDEEVIDAHQAGHSSRIANQIYGLSQSVSNRLSLSIVNECIKNSDRWCRDVLRLIP
ncbi:uncharacterized protein SCHCODRAFT_02458873, partial [Schizophyllum commune H4-8]|uniref:uncharacterized protein n=1 Tax=Schizophyllum commune (strain H4-8 / FGSC 9210) TaxID=578458 RepID=UPI00215FB7BF